MHVEVDMTKSVVAVVALCTCGKKPKFNRIGPMTMPPPMPQRAAMVPASNDQSMILLAAWAVHSRPPSSPGGLLCEMARLAAKKPMDSRTTAARTANSQYQTEQKGTRPGVAWPPLAKMVATTTAHMRPKMANRRLGNCTCCRASRGLDWGEAQSCPAVASTGGWAAASAGCRLPSVGPVVLSTCTSMASWSTCPAPTSCGGKFCGWPPSAPALAAPASPSSNWEYRRGIKRRSPRSTGFLDNRAWPVVAVGEALLSLRQVWMALANVL
mmetsp:Transcript_112764/g.313800  ORF Transcript_112764/g.313800 Transcript_112764/m.313800 type:complete len:269 (+) Transcript_112764:450-1256(+)